MEKIRSISRVIAIIMLPAIFALYYNGKTNEHLHIKNGRLIAHSHPFKSNSNHDPIQKHHHSPGVLHLLSLIGSNFTDGSDCLNFIEIEAVPETGFTHNIFKKTEVYCPVIFHFGLRAPPYFS